MSKLSLNYKGFIGSSEISFEDGCLHGKVLFIDDLITYEGETPKELQGAFLSAVDRYLAYCKKTGKAANKPYSGTFNVRIGAELHRRAVQSALKHDMRLNEYVTKAIQTAVEQNGITKVEHTHLHFVTVEGNAVSETRLATMQKPSVWEAIHATPQ